MEKVVEIEGKTAEQCHHTKEQKMADQHHTQIVFGKNNNQKKQNSADKNIKPETEKAFDQLPF